MISSRALALLALLADVSRGTIRGSTSGAYALGELGIVRLNVVDGESQQPSRPSLHVHRSGDLLIIDLVTPMLRGGTSSVGEVSGSELGLAHLRHRVDAYHATELRLALDTRRDLNATR